MLCQAHQWTLTAFQEAFGPVLELGRANYIACIPKATSLNNTRLLLQHRAMPTGPDFAFNARCSQLKAALPE